MCFMIHVGHCQVRLDYYTITFLFFNISYHSSGYLQLHSYEIITHGNLPKKKFHKLSVLVATSIILISLLWDIQAWIFVGRWVQDSKGSRTRGLRFSASLLITNCSSGDFSHCCVQELFTLLCPGASALSTSQEGPVVYSSWSSTSIPVSMPQLFSFLNKETLWSQIQRSISLQGWRADCELLGFEFLDLGCPV